MKTSPLLFIFNYCTVTLFHIKQERKTENKSKFFSSSRSKKMIRRSICIISYFHGSQANSSSISRRII